MINVSIKDFQVIEKTRIDIEGLTFLTGSFDNGKSSVVRALQYSMYNKTGDDFVRQGATNCIVAVKFGDGFKYAWKKAKGKGGEYLLEDGAYGKVGGKGFDGVLDKGLLPLDTSVDTFYLNFWNQMEQFLVVNRPDTHKFEILSSIFSGEKYQEMLKKVSVDIKEIRDQVSSLFQKKEVYESYIKTNTEKISCYTGLSSIEKGVSSVSKDIRCFNSLSAILSEYTIALNSTGVLDKELIFLRKADSYLSKKLSDLSSDIEKLVKLYDLVSKIEVVKTKRKALGFIKAYIKEAESIEAPDISTDIDRLCSMERLSRDYSSMVKRISTLSSSIDSDNDRLSELTKELKKFKSCPFCGNSLK